MITKAPLGGQATGPSPVDRAKTGTKRSLLTEGHGVPIGLAVGGANRPDMKLAGRTLDALAARRPSPRNVKQHLCLDRGYDYDEVRELVARLGYIAHIPPLARSRSSGFLGGADGRGAGWWNGRTPG